MRAETAEAFALTALGWLISDEDLLGTFMGSTGCDAEALRQGAANPEFLASVLDFLSMDDAWVLRCSEATGLAPEDFLLARHALPGGAHTHWT